MGGKEKTTGLVEFALWRGLPLCEPRRDPWVKPWWVLGALWHGMAAGGSSLLLGPDLTPAVGAGRRWPCSFLHGFRRNLLNSQSRSFEVSVSLSKLSLQFGSWAR